MTDIETVEGVEAPSQEYSQDTAFHIISMLDPKADIMMAAICDPGITVVDAKVDNERYYRYLVAPYYGKSGKIKPLNVFAKDVRKERATCYVISSVPFMSANQSREYDYILSHILLCELAVSLNIEGMRLEQFENNPGYGLTIPASKFQVGMKSVLPNKVTYYREKARTLNGSRLSIRHDDILALLGYKPKTLEQLTKLWNSLK